MNVVLKCCYATLFVLVALVTYCNGKAYASTLSFGQDITMHWYADKTNEMTLDNFLHQPDNALQTTHQIQSFGFSSNTYWLKAYLPSWYFQGNNLWLTLGPSFLDQLTVYYRSVSENNHWVRKDFGDRSTKENSDVNYRDAVLILPPPVTGYEVVFQMRSTSTLLLLATLASAKDFVSSATQETAFWGLYFSAALLVTGVALTMAIVLRRRLLWGICIFSLNYLLVAALHGFPAWLFGAAVLPIQDYMVSSLSLLGYATALWLHCEIFNIKKYMSRLYRFLMIIIIVDVLLQFSVPFDFYGKAMQIETIIFALVSPLLIITSLILWRRKNIDFASLVIGLMPPVYVLVVMFILLSLNGLIPFNTVISSLWQYTIIIHALAVMILAGSRVRAENRELEKKRSLVRELRIEREASFNQRQFMGMVAHEFRTPLAVIMAGLDNLRCSNEFIIHQIRLDRMYRAATRLVQLTDNCLAEARLSSGNLYIEKKKVALLNIIKTAAIVVELSENHYLKVTFNGQEVNLDESMPELYMDEGLISIVIANILDNSVKYTRGGVIEIAIALRNDCLELCFSDQGPGIPVEQAERVFERYYRSEAQKKNPNGTGLGLYVARQIVRAHGGELRPVIDGSIVRTFAMEFKVTGEQPVISQLLQT